MKRSQIVLIALASIIAITLRLVDRPWMNFSALGALALVCGAVVRPGWLGLLIPVGCRLLTDVALEVKTGYGFYNSMVFDYAAYVAIFFIGSLFQPKHLLMVLSSSVLAGATFFLISNLGVWMMEHEGQRLYPMTFAGLQDCFKLAIPFARGTFYGDILFSSVFFGGLSLLGQTLDASDPVAASKETVA